MKVGVITPSMSRQAGGLFWSVSGLSRSMQDLGCQVRIFASEDTDTGRDIGQWTGLDLRLLQRLGPASFAYMPTLKSSVEAFDGDILHTHGIWMHPSVVTHLWARLTSRPYVVSPRGMLDGWALQRGRWKKGVAGVLYENAHLRGSSCLHALCVNEAEAFRRYGLRNPICIIPNGVSVPEVTPKNASPWQSLIPVGSPVLLYIGRLHPKKNLVAFIDAWSRLHSRFTVQRKWHLVISGWDQGGYERLLRTSVERSGLSDCVHFIGPLFGLEKDAALGHADAFVLPSLSEGLPMAALEAWSYGLPILMTEQCNLPEGYEVDAARLLAFHSDEMVTTLAAFLSLDATALSAMGHRGRRLVEERFSWTRIAAEMFAVYRWIIDGGDPPSTVIQD